jgi:hypothetical protein
MSGFASRASAAFKPTRPLARKTVAVKPWVASTGRPSVITLR